MLCAHPFTDWDWQETNKYKIDVTYNIICKKCNKQMHTNVSVIDFIQYQRKTGKI